MCTPALHLDSLSFPLGHFPLDMKPIQHLGFLRPSFPTTETESSREVSRLDFPLDWDRPPFPPPLDLPLDPLDWERRRLDDLVRAAAAAAFIFSNSAPETFSLACLRRHLFPKGHGPRSPMRCP